MKLASGLIAGFILFTPVVFGEWFSIGVKGGVPLTNSFKDVTIPSAAETRRTFSDSNNYIVGGMVEVHLPFGLSIEGDGLYRPLNFGSETRVTPASPFIRTTSNISSWEFPIVGKFRLPFPVVKPYVEVGPTFRTVGSNFDYLSKHGVVAGLGVELKLARLRIGPEVRYTRWGSDSSHLGFLNQLGQSNLNQAELLVGISF